MTQLKAQGPSRTCNESKEEEENNVRVIRNGAGPPRKWVEKKMANFRIGQKNGQSGEKLAIFKNREPKNVLKNGEGDLFRRAGSVVHVGIHLGFHLHLPNSSTEEAAQTQNSRCPPHESTKANRIKWRFRRGVKRTKC